MKAFLKSVWGHVIDRVAELCVAAAALIAIVIRSGFSWRKIVEGRLESLAVFLTALALLIMWHAFRSAYAVSVDIKEESRPSGFATPAAPLHFQRVKLYGIAITLTVVAFTASSLLWIKVLHTAPAFASATHSQGDIYCFGEFVHSLNIPGPLFFGMIAFNGACTSAEVTITRLPYSPHVSIDPNTDLPTNEMRRFFPIIYAAPIFNLPSPPVTVELTNEPQDFEFQIEIAAKEGNFFETFKLTSKGTIINVSGANGKIYLKDSPGPVDNFGGWMGFPRKN